jgi:hypothetical protein
VREECMYRKVPEMFFGLVREIIQELEIQKKFREIV